MRNEMRAEPGRDEELVRGAVDGDAACFRALHDRYRERVYRFALRRTRDPVDAEDVTQDVFLEAYRSLASFRGDSRLSTWLFGIAHHRVLRHVQRRPVGGAALDIPEALHAVAAEAPADRRAEARRLLDHCGAVLERDVAPGARRAFELRYLRGRSLRQIADALDTSPNAVKCSLARTRRLLDDRTRGRRRPPRESRGQRAERLPEAVRAR